MGSTNFKLLGQIKVKSRNNPDFLRSVTSVTFFLFSYRALLTLSLLMSHMEPLVKPEI
jgi:hypothetical protein